MTAISRILFQPQFFWRAPISSTVFQKNWGWTMIIYLIQLQFCWRGAKIDIFARETGAGRPANFHSPRCDDTRGSTPKAFGVYGPAVLPLFCLAPHGVFPASRITPRAVSSYLAFSPLPALLSKNRRCLFCDTFRHCDPEHFRGCGARVFYAACCRMVFGLSSGKSSDSPAIICHRHAI